jgi:NTP pyrophosphatase (non-canonical NTP hydrolase)
MSSHQCGVRGPSPIEQIEFAVLCFYNHFYVNAGAQKPQPSQTALKITGELGELAETICKGWNKNEQEKEFGDVLVTLLMHGINSGYSLGRVANLVIEKLEDRRTCCTVLDGVIVKNKDLNGKPIKEKPYGIAKEQ